MLCLFICFQEHFLLPRQLAMVNKKQKAFERQLKEKMEVFMEEVQQNPDMNKRDAAKRFFTKPELRALYNRALRKAKGLGKGQQWHETAEGKIATPQAPAEGKIATPQAPAKRKASQAPGNRKPKEKASKIKQKRKQLNKT